MSSKTKAKAGYSYPVKTVGEEDANGVTQLRLDAGDGAEIHVSFLTNGITPVKPGDIYKVDAKGNVNISSK